MVSATRNDSEKQCVKLWLPEEIPRLALRAPEAALAIGISQRKLWDVTKRNSIPYARLGNSVIYPVHLLKQWLTRLLFQDTPREARLDDIQNYNPSHLRRIHKEMNRLSPGELVTYFIYNTALCHVKIGISERPWDRLLDLQQANSVPLRLLGVVRGNHEKEWHARFARQRLLGEWFDLNMELAMFIRERVGVNFTLSQEERGCDLPDTDYRLLST